MIDITDKLDQCYCFYITDGKVQYPVDVSSLTHENKPVVEYILSKLRIALARVQRPSE